MKGKMTAVFLAVSSLTALNAHAYDGSRYESNASVKMDQAKAIALKAYPGTIVEESLEKKHGKLHYAFDIRAHHVTHEVAVDASSGKVLQNSRETEKDDD
jgi:uncharacterized membrane protein YkoI